MLIAYVNWPLAQKKPNHHDPEICILINPNRKSKIENRKFLFLWFHDMPRPGHGLGNRKHIRDFSNR